jgi:hypothetical protein
MAKTSLMERARSIVLNKKAHAAALVILPLAAAIEAKADPITLSFADALFSTSGGNYKSLLSATPANPPGPLMRIWGACDFASTTYSSLVFGWEGPLQGTISAGDWLQTDFAFKIKPGGASDVKWTLTVDAYDAYSLGDADIQPSYQLTLFSCGELLGSPDPGDSSSYTVSSASVPNKVHQFTSEEISAGTALAVWVATLSVKWSQPLGNIHLAVDAGGYYSVPGSGEDPVFVPSANGILLSTGEGINSVAVPLPSVAWTVPAMLLLGSLVTRQRRKDAKQP